MNRKLYCRIRPLYKFGGSWAFVIGIEGGFIPEGLWAFGICLGLWVIEIGRKGELE